VSLDRCGRTMLHEDVIYAKDRCKKLTDTVYLLKLTVENGITFMI